MAANRSAHERADAELSARLDQHRAEQKAVNECHDALIANNRAQADANHAEALAKLESHKAEQVQIDEAHRLVQARVAESAAEDLAQHRAESLLMMVEHAAANETKFAIVEEALRELRWALAAVVGLASAFAAYAGYLR